MVYVQSYNLQCLKMFDRLFGTIRIKAVAKICIEILQPVLGPLFTLDPGDNPGLKHTSVQSEKWTKHRL